jgi:hypothetical protein
MRRVNQFLTSNFLKSLFEIDDLQEKCLWYKRVKAKLILLVVSTYSKTVKNDKNRDCKNNVSLLQSWYGLRLLPGAEEISSENKRGCHGLPALLRKKVSAEQLNNVKQQMRNLLRLLAKGFPS